SSFCPRVTPPGTKSDPLGEGYARYGALFVGFGGDEGVHGLDERVGFVEAVAAGSGCHAELAQRLDVASDGGLPHPDGAFAGGVVDEPGGGAAGGDQGTVCRGEDTVAA